METAANVRGLDNDTELVATTNACRDVDDWVAAIIANPGAGALTSYTVEDAQSLLTMTCVRSIESAVCIDASAEGILDFELDDPRLKELQG